MFTKGILYDAFQPQKEDNLQGPKDQPFNYPYGAPFSYNIPPGAESKESNTNVPVCMITTQIIG